LKKSSSLKINDYQEEKINEKANQIEDNERTITTGREARVDTLTGEPALLSGHRNE
jgi:hypothetical protein